MNAMTVAVRWRGMDPPERLLHALERRYAAALPRWRRQQWVAGMLTARVSLRLAAGTPLAGVMIMPGSNGAPTVLGGEDRELSLSHTTEWAASACGPAGLRFGIDIETRGACDQALLARVSGPGDTRSRRARRPSAGPQGGGVQGVPGITKPAPRLPANRGLSGDPRL